MEEGKIVVLQQAIIPDYRMGLFVRLREHYGSKFQIFAGDWDFGGTPISTKVAWGYFEHVENVYFLGARFLWQKGMFKHLHKPDVVIFNANIRIASNIASLFLRKLTGRPSILWGHATGKSRTASMLRGFYFRLCDGVVAYTESQGRALRLRYPWLKVWVAPNSCVSANDCVPVESILTEMDSILYVGRLVEAKKVSLLLEGFIYAREKSLLPNSVRLILVGDGAERAKLEERAAEAGVSDVVCFKGHVSDVSKLREYYSRAVCSVSPGYVGLSATQSFSFGIPMLIARDEFHSPEIEACKEDFNAYFFPSDDATALAEALSKMVENKSKWFAARAEVSKWTREHYSFEVMRDTFIRAVNEVTV
jgi:glycosyltransferase involved in cell wall biosynthesis